MPFDFSAPQTAAAALAMYAAACDDPASADWQQIAHHLAGFIPKPRKAKQAEPAPDAGEWCEYPAAAHKGRGGTFEANRQAEIMFADGAVIRVQLGHKKGKPQPDWARAVRCAVALYRAKHGQWVAVPEIALGSDLTRRAEVDVIRANAATHDLRRRTGPVQTVQRGYQWEPPHNPRHDVVRRFMRLAEQAGLAYDLIVSPDPWAVVNSIIAARFAKTVAAWPADKRGAV